MNDKEESPIEENPAQASIQPPAASNIGLNCNENSCTIPPKKTATEYVPKQVPKNQEESNEDKSAKKDSPKKDSKPEAVSEPEHDGKNFV